MANQDASLPTVVLEVNGGIINCIRSDAPVHIVVLDQDTEGGDEDQIKVVGDEEYYVSEWLLTTEADIGMDGIDLAYVEDVIKQI